MLEKHLCSEFLGFILSSSPGYSISSISNKINLEMSVGRVSLMIQYSLEPYILGSDVDRFAVRFWIKEPVGKTLHVLWSWPNDARYLNISGSEFRLNVNIVIFFT